MLGLTIYDGIQLSVASEALGAGKPMVLSDTTTLKKLFYQGSVFVDSSSAQSIAKGCLQALDQRYTLAEEVRELSMIRAVQWQRDARVILSEIQQHQGCTG